LAQLFLQRVPLAAVGTAAKPFGRFVSARGAKIDFFGFRCHVSPFVHFIFLDKRLQDDKGNLLLIFLILQPGALLSV
jgi:hypothetical protein